ncbi:hypothetical protein BO94DRAFT_366200 [Aspergillus sclerotioniger CBS 115572]|uniref:Uncharacterized protein n=1 Tax=Aspergillus sclerotioniger CBS 115572 TaxID=1450535 RepID=A0A317X3U9_9EURO|nr:hypothetical protein BO94DRAFT_366200 [Aspergillus sclerotioniger CBS 115572]PWY93289.1 hypothetical protein BO94DRAFT_366200 [Aspergillus sclerotioniger CBS 115572]
MTEIGGGSQRKKPGKTRRGDSVTLREVKLLMRRANGGGRATRQVWPLTLGRCNGQRSRIGRSHRMLRRAVDSVYDYDPSESRLGVCTGVIDCEAMSYHLTLLTHFQTQLPTTPVIECVLDSPKASWPALRTGQVIIGSCMVWVRLDTLHRQCSSSKHDRMAVRSIHIRNRVSRYSSC